MSGWHAGPVVITGASGKVGRALQARLARAPNEVRALGRGADLAAAFQSADAVVHLAGTLRPRRPDTYREANLGTVLATADALRGSGVRRVVFVSFLTARSGTRNRYLRYKAQAEESLRTGGWPLVVLRCGHIYGPPDDPGPTVSAFLARRGRVRLLGDGAQRLAPVLREDVVETIVRAALDPAAPTGTFELVGPETFTAREFARRLNPGDVRISATPAPVARALPLVLRSLPRPLVDVLLQDAVATGDPAATPRAFGVRMHTLDEAWPSSGPGAPR